ncbi:MAG TPA: cisplatin damage response ATP-dependent DNA ligase, partial [Hyphomicrobiaceae bacterium]|nr:cisplatin damage response ATP-dependent DNA ligase [Hyphomicrobiaceae bacterium]
AKASLADAFAVPLEDVEEVWHAVAPPYRDLFDWLEGRADRPDPGRALVFRPMMLAHPIAEADLAAIDFGTMVVEWKWDGIRVQVAADGTNARLFSRTGDDISAAFPDIVMHAGFDAVLDGELLVVRDGAVQPFSDLQQRLNRRAVTPRHLKLHPAHVRLYDCLFVDGEDLRSLPFGERRRRLEAWYESPGRPRPRFDLSPVIPARDRQQLADLVSGARAAGHEGLMLKRLDSPYLAGRPKGHWWKWKRDALVADCVLMYAQRGSGKRSSLYSDLTFGCWRDEGDGQRLLVSVGKAYSGFTDAELRQLDRWIRTNTTDRFGPVRAVAPGLVLEVAFDAVQRSSRHKSGLALRFPRINRLRWDKPAAEADDVTVLESLVDCAAI